MIKSFLCSILFQFFFIFPGYANDIELDYLGEQILPHSMQVEKTIVGGLSSLDYDPATDMFATISDDRSKINPARFYGLKLDYDLNGFRGYAFTAVNILKKPRGRNFSKPEYFGRTFVDPEAMRFAPDGQSLYWSSEGHAKFQIKPFIREMTLKGHYIRDFLLPQKYLPTKKKGVRNNLGFEAMSVGHNKKSLFVMTEGPLIQDGAEPTIKSGADVRLLEFDLMTGKPIHEYVYEIARVHKESLPLGNSSVNGVTDLLAVDEDNFIIVERSFSVGAGLSVKLWLADKHGATDMLFQNSLKGADYQKLRKRLLLDLGTLGIEIDNIEGLTWGKTLKDGRRSLLLISDNNFRSAQKTQILLFAVSGF